MTTTKAHGLDGSLVAPDWPALTADEVTSLLAQYPEVKGPFRLLSASPRPFSAASVVATRDRRVFVKRHAKTVRDAEGLREEHCFMAYLRAHGASVPDVLATGSGETAVDAGEWCYEAHTVPDGLDLYEDMPSWLPFRSAAHARAAGGLLARMHLAAEGFDAPARGNRALVASFSIFAENDAESAMRRFVEQRPALRKYVDGHGCGEEALELLAPFHAELMPLLPGLAPLWTHNDLHGSNLFWSDASQDAHPTAAIDFGLCDRTNAVHDLAHAIERSVVGWLALVHDPDKPEGVPVQDEQLWALLEGYESVRRLSTQELAGLAPMTALCHAEFALSEADYFLSVVHSDEKAGMACEGYLVSHARWWRTSGATLLNALREWAQKRMEAVAE